jgi:melibiose permease/lactose/raffinose/galactose permease
MIPALSSDASARDQFTSRATLFAGVGGTLASIMIPMLTTGAMTIGGSANVAYSVIAIVISILAPLFICFTLFGVKERRDMAKAPKGSLGFKKIIKTFAGNDQLLWISLIFLIQQIGNGIVVGGVGSTYIYFVYGYEGGLYSLFTTVGMSATAFLMIFYPVISSKIPRKKLMGIMAVISTIGYVLMIASRMVSGVSFVLLVIGYMLSNFGQYCYYLVMMISIINTVEYNEYKHGTREEALIASVRPFMTKMSSALIVMFTSISYIIFGVTDYTNQISDLESASASGLISETEKLSAIQAVIGGVEKGQTLGLLIFMTVIPCALMLTSYFLYKKNYKLDEAEYKRICDEIAARK